MSAVCVVTRPEYTAAMLASTQRHVRDLVAGVLLNKDAYPALSRAAYQQQCSCVSETVFVTELLSRSRDNVERTWLVVIHSDFCML